MINKNVKFGPDHKTIHTSYSFCKNPINIQHDNAEITKVGKATKSVTYCDVGDLIKEMNEYFDVETTEIISSCEYKEWVQLRDRQSLEKKQLIKRCNKAEDELVLQFEKNQQLLIKKFREAEEELASKFETEQNELMVPYQKELDCLSQQHEKEKCLLWEKSYEPVISNKDEKID